MVDAAVIAPQPAPGLPVYEQVPETKFEREFPEVTSIEIVLTVNQSTGLTWRHLICPSLASPAARKSWHPSSLKQSRRLVSSVITYTLLE
jgi:hypothetical protein